MTITAGVGSASAKQTPIIRWAGSKRRLLPRLAEYWAARKHQRYLEPFAGSGALFFHLAPEVALLNDLNAELIQAYRVLAADPERLHAAVTTISSDERTYYAVREQEVAQLSDFDRAARFIYLNRFCFNGIYRTNKNGKFNVPYGAKKSGAVPQLDRFLASAQLLKRATLQNTDFQTFVEQNVQADDFVYLDPPYAVANRRIFRQYDPNTFGTDDVGRLSALLEFIHSRGATFLVSYAQSSEVKCLSKRWSCRRVIAQRNVAGFVHHRRRAVEVMITNME